MNKRIIVLMIIIFLGILVYLSVPKENAEVPDRQLNQAHLSYIESRLNNYEGEKIIITYIAGNKEGKIFAGDIGNYLRATGRTVKEETSWNIFERKQGQYIGLNKEGIIEIKVFRKGYYED